MFSCLGHRCLWVAVLLTAGGAVTAQDRFRPGGGNANPGPAAPANPGSGMIASVEFVNAPITNIFRMVSDLTGWSIVTSPEVTKSPPKINLWIKNLTPSQVMDQVMTMGSLISERKGNVITVMTFDEYVELYGLEQKIIKLQHAEAQQMATMLEPFTGQEKEKGRIVADAASNSLILLLPEPTMTNVLRLIGMLDVPLVKDELKLVKLHHVEASELVPELENFLVQGGVTSAGRSSSGGDRRLATGSNESQTAGAGWLVRFMVEPKLNLVILRGLPSDVIRTVALIEQLDVPSQLIVRGYQLQYTNVEDVYDTLSGLIDQDLGRSGSNRNRGTNRTGGTNVGGGLVRLRVASAEHNNRIIVEGSKRDHERIAGLLAEIDQPLPPGTGGTRVYRLENASAAEVVSVIEAVIEEREGGDALARRRNDPTGRDGQSADASAGDVEEARVVSAEEINAVIIKASAAEHEEFANIITDLDLPRDQVLLEFTLVSVRSDDTFRLGVEMGGSVGIGGVDLIGFSSFGIAEVDPTTGALAFPAEPAAGLNFGVFNHNDFTLVLNALKTVGDVRITSSPRLLVQDNAEGQISQINQEPFESRSQSTSTTLSSFGGFVDAGTTMAVTPHISRDGWLRLDYAIQLSSFGTRNAAQTAANLPPPRRESTSEGTVRIPEGHIAVVGGMVGSREDQTEDKIPLLGDVPVFGELFKDRASSKSHETLYIFIRPVVLRDASFADLLTISAQDALQARVGTDEPANDLKLFLHASDNHDGGR